MPLVLRTQGKVCCIVWQLLKACTQDDFDDVTVYSISHHEAIHIGTIELFRRRTVISIPSNVFL